ncbi:hypothetical protein FDENT_10932 [Fusarium denticulatum]|uniref:G domain-containing protein n=1 Tax=Fusarium denticulatum TaxID=48507 RepID=A0A8H5TJR6_9HYPO|nr:hypothetical protein FDENT_10932 [Fusarium denticulatum]
MDILRPALPPMRVHTSLFRGGQKACDSDVFIAVMGLTGSGKSTFISHLTKSAVPIGSELQSCTREVAVYPYQYSNSTNVYLVDTPGFDDTNLSDSDVLREIATWLTGSYNNKVNLTGILYFHRITDIRMGGSARKNLFMFKKLCGPKALKNVLLVTTMWELVDKEIGAQRQAELETTEDFWGYMLSKGSRIEKHMNTSEPNYPVVLAIQDEMVNKNKHLDETEAGKGLEGVLAQERERFKQDLDQARQEMQEAIAARDIEAQEELQRQQDLAESKLERLRLQQEEIKVAMEQLHKEKYEKLEADLEKHKEEMKANTDEKEAMWAQEKLELKGKVTYLLMSCLTKMTPHSRCEVEPAMIPAWDRTISLSLSGQNWAFMGPHLSKWSGSEKVNREIASIPKGDRFRTKKLVFGERTDSYFSHHHTGRIITRCHCLANRIWWGFEGSYVMEMQDTTLVSNLRGYYGTLQEILVQRTNVKIKELAMDIQGGKAFALILEDKTIKFETNGEESNWDVSFKEYVTMGTSYKRVSAVIQKAGDDVWTLLDVACLAGVKHPYTKTLGFLLLQPYAKGRKIPWYTANVAKAMTLRLEFELTKDARRTFSGWLGAPQKKVELINVFVVLKSTTACRYTATSDIAITRGEIVFRLDLKLGSVAFSVIVPFGPDKVTLRLQRDKGIDESFMLTNAVD